jgi:hypothetical protein
MLLLLHSYFTNAGSCWWGNFTKCCTLILLMLAVAMGMILLEYSCCCMFILLMLVAVAGGIILLEYSSYCTLILLLLAVAGGVIY